MPGGAVRRGGQAVQGRDGPERRHRDRRRRHDLRRPGRSTSTTPATPSSSASSRRRRRAAATRRRSRSPARATTALARLCPAARPGRRRRHRAAHRRPRRATRILARSIDGGRTFGPARPDLRRAVRRGRPRPGRPARARRRPDHDPRRPVRARRLERQHAWAAELGPFLEGVFTDIASNGTEVLAAGSDANVTHAFRPARRRQSQHRRRLAADRPARPRPRAEDRRPAGGGFAAMLEPSGRSRQPVRRAPRARRLVAARRASRARSTTPDYQLASNAKGRLTVVIIYSRLPLLYTTSTDGGVLWSSLVNTGNFRKYPNALELATNAVRRRRRGRSTPRSTTSASASRASRPAPRPSRAAASAARASRSAASATTTSSSRSSSRPPAALAA